MEVGLKLAVGLFAALIWFGATPHLVEAGKGGLLH